MAASPGSQTVLVLNAGCSSVKFAIVVVPPLTTEHESAPNERVTSGSVADIGPQAVLTITAGGRPVGQDRRHVASHADAARWALQALGAGDAVTA